MTPRLFILAIASLTVAACGPDRSSISESPSVPVGRNEIGPARKLEPGQLLQPMSDAEWRANIKDGIGCSLHSGEHLLLLVILGEGSIAKTGGAVRKLSGGEAGFDWKGGRYETDGLTIDVSAGTASEAQVRVAVGDEREQFQARWGCGS